MWNLEKIYNLYKTKYTGKSIQYTIYIIIDNVKNNGKKNKIRRKINKSKEALKRETKKRQEIAKAGHRPQNKLAVINPNIWNPYSMFM